MKICLLGLENLPVLAGSEYGNYYFGGEQVQQTLLAKALRRCGYDVSMVIGDYGQKDRAVWDGICTYKAFRFDAGLPIFRFVYPRWVKIWSALRRANADVYYTSCAGMHVGLLALFCGRYRRAFVFRLASDGDADPAKVMIPYWRDKWLYKYGLKKADYVLSQHEKQQEKLKLAYGVQSSIADLFVQMPEHRISFQEKDIDILWVSNLQPVKRPDLILKLARLLPHRRFSMIGGKMLKAENLYQRIMHEAASIPNLTFHGSVTYRNIGKYFDRAKIFVNTSDLEGYPNTYLQAWSRGVPVVAFFDPSDMIMRRGLGKKVESLEEMKRVVENLLRDDIQYQIISTNAQKYAEETLNEENVVKDYIIALESAYGKVRIGNAKKNKNGFYR